MVLNNKLSLKKIDSHYSEIKSSLGTKKKKNEKETHGYLSLNVFTVEL